MSDHQVVGRVVTRAVGQELRRAREERGWSREILLGRLPSGIGDRTLHSYEHGLRPLTVARVVEICGALGVSVAGLLAYALQRARIRLDSLELVVDLHAVLNDDEVAFRSLRQWAQNKLNRHPDGIAQVAPLAVRELADFLGCEHEDLSRYLARFLPDTQPPVDEHALIP